MAMTVAPHQVLQRTVPGGCELAGASVPLAVTDEAGSVTELAEPRAGEALLPTGGPYTLHLRDGAVVDDVHVGDLWLLAGQSNIEGNGEWVDPTPAHPHVRVLGLDRRWHVAEEPLHEPLHAADAVRLATLDNIERRRRDEVGPRTIGTGPGLPFAVALTTATGTPTGLVAAAHDGSTMQEWDPGARDRGGESLYGSTWLQVQAAGGSVTGVIWYQGESDSHPAGAATYGRALTRLIAALRRDFHASTVIQVQQCRLGVDPQVLVPKLPLLTDESWSRVRDLQRTGDADVVVSAVDLSLHDFIHLDRRSVQRLGERLARAAVGEPVPSIGTLTRRGDTVEIAIGGLTVADLPARVAGVTLHVSGQPPIPLAATLTQEDCLEVTLPQGRHPADAAVAHAYGLAPEATFHDDRDLALPGFGPLPLPRSTSHGEPPMRPVTSARSC